MIESKIKQLAESRGFKSALELQRRADLTPPTALRLWRGVLTTYSVETLDKLCEVLRCQPGDLLTYKDDGR